MKLIILLIGVLSCQSALAVSATINCASTNIPQTYSTSSANLPTTLKSFQTPNNPSLAIINNTSVRICVNSATASAIVAPTSGVNEHCVAPQMFAFYDNINMPYNHGNIYIRSDQSTCTTGTVDLDVW